MKVIINGETVRMKYADICHKLGFTPEVQFVKVTRTGRIDFTLAFRQSEAEALWDSIIDNGMEPSVTFRRFVARQYSWGANHGRECPPCAQK